MGEFRHGSAVVLSKSRMKLQVGEGFSIYAVEVGGKNGEYRWKPNRHILHHLRLRYLQLGDTKYSKSVPMKNKISNNENQFKKK